MKALVFHYNLARLAYARLGGFITRQAYLGGYAPLQYQDVPEPRLPADDWVILRTALCGICGSDTKEIFLDANLDNPLSALVSFPHILGHEVTGVIEEVGPGVRQRRVGERVALNPWLSCTPRGIAPVCPACQRGEFYFCEHFKDGSLPPGMHTGNNPLASGGYAPFLPAHESQLFPVPENVPFNQAVLADPFSVSLHAVLKAPPKAGELALVYGCGSLGLLTVAILSKLYPKAEIVAIARHPFQEKMARQLGAQHVIRTRSPREIIEGVGELTHQPLQKPFYGLPWLLSGLDVVYDTVGSAQTLEVGLRVLRPRGSIVVTGVSQPQRFEWTPHYFKEINLIGSNAFGIEEFEGQRRHAMQIYLDLLASERLELPELVTHRFRLEQYQQALLVSHDKEKNQAVKVVFDFQ
ncbi:MAG: zinc-binding dehydrogenase [Anaerolineales bacterium]|nr:zinc-binding dehydrogenase [Anaerolineales bacterium]